MSISLRPCLRPLEMIPLGRAEEASMFVFRDPDGFGESVVVPFGAAMLATMMDGKRTLAEIQTAFRHRVGANVSLEDLQKLVRQFDEGYLLQTRRFEEHCRREIEQYRRNRIRPAVHAGRSYAADADELRRDLAEMFASPKGPGAIDARARANGRAVCGIISPHIDFGRGGPAFAWAYQKLAEESRADLFVVFGTAHRPMSQPFCISRKDFDTPLGTVETDRAFIDRLAERLARDDRGRDLDLESDELAHRQEHSIEFQAVFLQYLLGPQRRFRMVPVLTGALYEFMESGRHPDRSPPMQAFFAALRATAQEHPAGRTSKPVRTVDGSAGRTVHDAPDGARVCFIAGADLAHVGQQFGDHGLLDDAWLSALARDDQDLLAAACRSDAARFFHHVADANDRYRICGLAPIYALLKAIHPAEGRLLRYEQAVDADRTSCVSFASVAFWGRESGVGSRE